jgi:hypothetical protein
MTTVGRGVGFLFIALFSIQQGCHVLHSPLGFEISLCQLKAWWQCLILITPREKHAAVVTIGGA